MKKVNYVHYYFFDNSICTNRKLSFNPHFSILLYFLWNTMTMD